LTQNKPYNLKYTTYILLFFNAFNAFNAFTLAYVHLVDKSHKIKQKQKQKQKTTATKQFRISILPLKNSQPNKNL